MKFQAKVAVSLAVIRFTLFDAFALTEVVDEMPPEDDDALLKEVCRNHQV